MDALLDEIALIRRELGYPIMVTPISQYIGAQAVLNHTSGERYRIVTDEVIKYILGHYGDLAAPVNPDVKARVMKMPRTQELLDWAPTQRSIEDLREEYDPDLSDEEFLLRVLSSNQQAVDEVLAAGPKTYDYPSKDKPILELVQQLTGRKDIASISIQKGDFSLTLR